MRTSRLAAFAALALLASQAVADSHIREYVVPYVPGADRATFRNIFIVVTNHKGQSAPISINAHVNRSGTAQSCGSLTNLAPFEIRRFARNAGTLCVARDEDADSSLRIRTVEGVHVTGYLVLDASRNNALVPLDVFNVTPAGTTPTPPEPPGEPETPPDPETPVDPGATGPDLTLAYAGIFHGRSVFTWHVFVGNIGDTPATATRMPMYFVYGYGDYLVGVHFITPPLTLNPGDWQRVTIDSNGFPGPTLQQARICVDPVPDEPDAQQANNCATIPASSIVPPS